MPVEGSLLGGPLYNKFIEVSNTSTEADTMLYNPYYELQVSNWLDGADFEPDVEVDMQGVGYDGTIYNIAGHRTLQNGNKIAFLAYDPLSLDQTPDYYWYGFSASAPQVQVLNWFGIISNTTNPICGDADEDGLVMAFDASKTLMDAIGLIVLTPQGEANADVNMDEMVTAFDAALIIRNVLGLPEPVPTCFDAPLMPHGKNMKDVPLALNKTMQKDTKGNSVVNIKLDGIITQDGVYSFQSDVELAGSGEININGLPSDYISGVHKIDDTHFKVAVVAPHGINGEDVTISINFDDVANTDVTFSNISLNDQTIDNIVVGVENDPEITSFKLVGNYPNPFNPSTKIVFEVPTQSNVRIEIYNVLGQKVRTLINGERTPGHYEMLWNATDDSGNKLSSGMYIAVMNAGDYNHSIKMNLVK
jgi:hypothetical protein